MASTLDWKSSEDPRDIVHIVVQALVEGRLVALPAETAYHVFASGLKTEAVRKLVELTSTGGARNPAVFLRSPQESLDYSPSMSRVASRIVNRGWPGPLVLELPAETDSSLASCLPQEVRSHLLVDHRFLAQRVASHEAILQAMRLLPGPLVASPMLDGQQAAICNGQDAARLGADAVSVVVDDGVTHYGGFATTVRVDGNDCRVMAPGVLDADTLSRLSQLIILLVCTGNTCRSPMAEMLMRQMFAKRFPKLFASRSKPALIASAGLSAFPGGPASTEAISVMNKRGLNLKNHQSRSVSERSLRDADLVLTMTNSHRCAIVDRMPDLASKIHLLSGSDKDVSDPFGGSESVYSACADQIESYLSNWIGQIEESWFPIWHD